jgi:flagellar basal-body rod protein FlgC
MSLTQVFNIASSALAAETMRLTSSATNLSNANAVAGKPEDVYKPQYPVFKAIQDDAMHFMGEQTRAGVEVTGIYQSTAEPEKSYEPNHPLADKDGYIYEPKIDEVAEMANTISAARSYEMALNFAKTSKQLMQQTLHLGE